MTAEYQDICGDGGCLKKILQPSTVAASLDGEPESPPKGCEVTVHYTGTLEDGTKFDSSRDRNDPFKFKLGQGQVIKGWDEGVASMKRGERAMLKLRSDYAYGDNGSPPKIPGGATLLFDVELLDWDSWLSIATKQYSNKGLQKQILRDSDASQVRFGSQVTVNYTVKCKGAEVVKKSNENIVIGNEQVADSLERAIKSMKQGEKARFKLNAKFAPKEYLVDASAENVQYEIEVVSAVNEKKHWDMTDEEKLQAFEKRKDEGNALFKAQKLAQAEKRYKKALQLVETSFESDADKKRASKNKCIALLNMAAVQLKQRQYKDALTNADKAIKEDNNNLKAHFRRAQANIGLIEYDTAKQDLQKALAIDANSKEVKDEMAKLNDLIKKQNQKDKAMYSKMFSALGGDS